MSAELDNWQLRIKGVEREFLAVRFSLERTVAQVRADSSIFIDDLELPDFVDAARMLEGTYIMRLFAEFESAVRRYFQLARNKRPPSKTEDLLNSVASHRYIQFEQLQNAHRVRIYRNNLVHERHRGNDPLGITEARGYLCRFLSFLPRDW